MNDSNSPLPEQTPGAMILRQIKARGLQQQIVAAIAHIDATQFSRMLSGKRPIDVETALRLREAIGIDVQALLQLQLQNEIDKAQSCFTDAAAIRESLQVYTSAPIADMSRRGWLPEISSVKDLRNTDKVKQSLKNFFQVDAINDIPSITKHAAKKTHEATPATPAQIAWVGRARRIATAIALPQKFHKDRFNDLLTALRPLLLKENDIDKVVSILADFGIRLVFVEKLKSAKIDGACFSVNEAPVIAMSLRFDRIDNFWFILLHELEHIRNGDDHLIAIDDGTVMQHEAMADAAYVRYIDPCGIIKHYVQQGTFSATGIRNLAETLHIHPGLVTGQIQHLTGNYALFRSFLVHIRNYIIAAGRNVDGWNTIAPVA